MHLRFSKKLYSAILCQNHHMIISHAVVGDSVLILITWGSLICTQHTVHRCFCISPTSKCGHSGRDLILGPRVQQRDAKATRPSWQVKRFGDNQIKYYQNKLSGTVQKNKTNKQRTFYNGHIKLWCMQSCRNNVHKKQSSLFGTDTLLKPMHSCMVNIQISLKWQ